MPFTNTIDILNAWSAEIALLPQPGAEAALFPKIGIFANKNLSEALKTTYTFDDRVCFLIPTAEEYTNERNGLQYITKRVTEITMLISDRNYGTREEALVGGDGTIGVLAMKDLIIGAFTGQNVGLPGIRLTPYNSESYLVSSHTDSTGGKLRAKLTGREGWAIQWRTDAGYMATRLDRLSS